MSYRCSNNKHCNHHQQQKDSTVYTILCDYWELWAQFSVISLDHNEANVALFCVRCQFWVWTHYQDMLNSTEECYEG